MRTQEAVIVAEACHAMVKSYCESVGDTAGPQWADLPEYAKYNYVDAVQACAANPKIDADTLSLWYDADSRIKNNLFKAMVSASMNILNFGSTFPVPPGCVNLAPC